MDIWIYGYEDIEANWGQWEDPEADIEGYSNISSNIRMDI
jgi:hypothetical protein